VNRRDFIVLISGAAVAWPLAASGEQGRLPTIGFLGATTQQAVSHWVVAFERRLRELGWSEGRTVAIEYRWAEGRSDRFIEIAAEFVRLNVDIIVTYATAPTLAAKQTTSIIPIVFATAGDPVGTGLVASLPRPGGNITGLSNQQADLAGKRLELFREIVPTFRNLTIMGNVNAPASLLEMKEVETAARALSLEVDTIEIRKAEEITSLFAALKDRAGALYVVGDPLVFTNRVRISTLAVGARVPTIYNFREYVQAGGLMSYGPNFPDFVDKILRGTKPADIPVEQPTKFDLVINLTTAKALGLEVPPTLLATADEVIE
jgi:putative ABC transport system substrate-binding protein